jgi:hypothetical protein
MTDESTAATEDLSDEAKKKLNPKLAKLAELRARAEAVIERTEEEEVELIESALEEDFGNKATTVTGELPSPDESLKAATGAAGDAASEEPATLEPSEATPAELGGDADASVQDSGAPAADVAADQPQSTPESGAESGDLAGETAAPEGSDSGAVADPAPAGEADDTTVAEVESHPGTPQQDFGVVNSTDNEQPPAVTERDALPADAVPAGEVPVNNGNPDSPQTVATADLVGEGSDLTADNSPLPPDAVDSTVTESSAEGNDVSDSTDPSVEAVTNTEAQTTSDAEPLPATPGEPNTPIRED